MASWVSVAFESREVIVMVVRESLDVIEIEDEVERKRG